MPPLVAVALAWMAGLIAAHHWLELLGVEPVSLAVLLIIPLVAMLLWRKDRAAILRSTCVLVALLGAIRYQMGTPRFEDPEFVAHYNDRGWFTLEGIVREFPDVRDTRTNLAVDTDRIESDGQAQAVRGTVLVNAPRFPEYRYGDRLRITGRLATPPEFAAFSYRNYLARKNIYSVINQPRIEKLDSDLGSPFWQATFTIKNAASHVVSRLIPEPEASLLQGILLGIRSGIPRDLYNAYNATGTSHIIVISGANIMIIAALFSRSFGRLFGRRRAYWFTMAGILLYVLLIGADPVVTRAGVMACLYVSAVHLGRRATAYVSLLASALLITAVSPHTLWDLGFQLSLAATLGLVLFTPGLERMSERLLTRFVSVATARVLLRYLNDLLIVTLAAQILTIPLLIHAFQRLSLVSTLANLLILPVQPPIMAIGGISALLGLVPWLEPVARTIAWLPWLCLAYTNAVVRLMAALPSASLPISQSRTGWLLLAYGLALGFIWAVRHQHAGVARLWTRVTNRPSTKIVLTVPLVSIILISLALLQLPDGRLHVAFLDVGQGDAILVTTPRGQQILVDGGPSPASLTTGLGARMPFWDRSIDLVVMTHPDSDHITGLTEVLQRFKVGAWLDNGCSDDDSVYRKCLELLEENAVPRTVARAGDHVALGGGLNLEVLHPPLDWIGGSPADSNNSSAVLRLVWEQASFLLTGDVEAEGEQFLLQSGQPLAATVLKVGHHGSGGSSTTEFLSAVDPQFAVISVGADNPFGHPQQAVLDRLSQLGGITVFRTDDDGSIEFITDGRHMWIQTGR